MLNENYITSKENPVIKLYTKLASSRKERLLYGLFVLEGLRLVQDALCEKINVKYLIFTADAYKKYVEEFSQADLNDATTLVISNELGNKIAQTEKTQGVFAICPILTPDETPLSSDDKLIVLHKLQDPGNVGMIIRTADALGINSIIMCGCCDLYSPKVIRATMGSVFRMNLRIINDEDKLFEFLHSSDIRTYASVIDSDADKIGDISFNKGAAVFIGNEGNGLPDDIANKCDSKITIPMSGNINSLNAAMAAGIIMWELKA